MKEVLSLDFVTNQIKEWSDTDTYPLSKKEQENAVEYFYKLMTEEVNKNKDLKTQESLLGQIARKIYRGYTKEQLFREHGDNAHMNYFDNFLQPGEGQVLQDLFEKMQLPTEILRDIRKDQPFGHDYTVGNRRIRIEQEIEKQGPGESPTVKRFEIIVNGKTIYKFRRNEETKVEPYMEMEEDEIPVPQKRTKSGNEVVKVVYTPNEKITFEKVKIKGVERTIARGKGGRFTSIK